MNIISSCTTIGIGGYARNIIEAQSKKEIINTLKTNDKSRTPLIVLGGGSNILFPNDRFHGNILRIMNDAYKVVNFFKKGTSSKQSIIVSVQAGYIWDKFVCESIKNKWQGLELMSGIPGTVGGASSQNIGAYGSEISQNIIGLYCWDRKANNLIYFDKQDLFYSYRYSLFKTKLNYFYINDSIIKPRFVILEVIFQLISSQTSNLIKNKELIKLLGLNKKNKISTNLVRYGVLKIRKSKSMIFDFNDKDSCSTGSFFVNPFVDFRSLSLMKEKVRTCIIHKALMKKALYKISAAWLIEQSGFPKGYGLRLSNNRASLSNKHVLAITNRNNALYKDVISIACTIKKKVKEKFNINLVPETDIINYNFYNTF